MSVCSKAVDGFHKGVDKAVGRERGGNCNVAAGTAVLSMVSLYKDAASTSTAQRVTKQNYFVFLCLTSYVMYANYPKTLCDVKKRGGGKTPAKLP